MSLELRRRRPVWRLVGFVALLAIIIARHSYGEDFRPDSWEASPPSGMLDCYEIDRALIAAIPSSHRPDSVARLENVSIDELSQGEASRVLDDPTTNHASALARINAAINALSSQRRSELDERVGGWSVADQERLARLQVLASNPSSTMLKPFLVRAIAKNEATGGFYASICADSLVINHGSLGQSMSPSRRIPIIVFLERKPSKVYVGWSMAE